MARMVELYPYEFENLDGYRETLSRLRSLEPVPGNIRIVLTETPSDEDDDGDPWIDVSGKDGTLNHETHPFPLFTDEAKQWGEKEASKGIEFTPWNQWLGMTIDHDTVASFSMTDILVHCLWEMTFAGFDQTEIHDRIESMREMVRDYRTRHPDEKETERTEIPTDPPDRDVQEDDDSGETERPT